MKKILFVIPTLTNGGAERVASIIANSLCEVFDVRFFLLEQDGKIAYEINSKIKVTSALMNVPKRGNKLSTVYNYFKKFSYQYEFLCEEMEAFRPEYVVSFLPKADMLVYKLKKYFPFKWISSERNDPTVRNFIERQVLQYIYKKTDGFICQSRVVAAYYQQRKVRNCVVIPNPVNDGISLNEDVPYSNYAIAVGRFNAQKNYELLIKSFFRATLETKSDIRLIILGEGPLKSKCSDLVNQIGAQEKILFLGRKTNVGDYLRKANFFIMSSKYEGMPNALVEAMNAGLPVICTDFFTGTARDLVSEDNGFLVPVDSENDLTSAIKQMFAKTDASLIEMGKCSREKLGCMEVENVCQMWKNLITNLQ